MDRGNIYSMKNPVKKIRFVKEVDDCPEKEAILEIMPDSGIYIHGAIEVIFEPSERALHNALELMKSRGFELKDE